MTSSWDSRPWAARSAELTGSEHPLNHFGDYEAFEEWYTSRGLDETLDDGSTIERADVYHQFCESFGVSEVIPDRTRDEVEF